MAKHKLFLEDDYSFELIGICSSNADYKLCWGINNTLGINLRKIADLNLMLKKQGEQEFSFYEYFDETEHITYNLVKNLSHQFVHLIPEKDQIDYFLLIKNNYTLELNNILTSLKDLDTILTAFKFDPEELKSKANLIF